MSPLLKRAPFLLVSLILVQCHWQIASAQTKALDELKSELLKENDPLRRIDLHLGICRAATFYGDFEQGWPHLDTALELSQQVGYVYGEVRTLLMQATYLEENYDDGYKAILDQANAIAIRSNEPRIQRMIDFTRLSDLLEIGDLEGSEELLPKLLSKYPQQTDGQKASAYFYQAELHYLKGEDSLAIEAYRKALPLYDALSENPPIVPELKRPSSLHTHIPYMNQAKIQVEIGRLLCDLGRYEEALDFFSEAEKRFKDAGADSFLGWVLMDKGHSYAEQGDLETAVEIGQKAISIFERLGLESDLADAYFELSRLYLYQGDLDATEIFLKKSQNIIANQTNYSLEFDVCQAFAQVFSLRQNPKAAREYLEKGVTVAEKSKDVLLLAPGLSNLSEGLYLDGGFEEAIVYAHQARKIATEFHSNQDISKANSLLTDSYLSLNNIDSAKYYHRQNSINRNSGVGTSQKKKLALQGSKIAELELDYKTALAEWKNYHRYNELLFSGAAQGKLKEEQVRQNVNEIYRSKELAIQEAELLSRQNQLYLLLAFGLGGILIFAGYAYQQIRKVKLELESKNLQLQQLNTTKDKFFGIIAHDIRSPIVALDGVGEQMSYYLENGKILKLKRLASRVNGTAKRLSSLLDNLLNWALLQQGVIPYHPKSIEVAASAAKVFEMFKDNAEVKNIQLVLEVTQGQLVYADEAALQTILRNLVSNAIKFTPQHGRVSIGTEVKDNQVFIKVSDTGTGFSAELMKRLFKLEKVSETGTAGEKGTGLGLTLVKELAELNRGSLSVNSEPLLGAVVLISLPMAA